VRIDDVEIFGLDFEIIDSIFRYIIYRE
jgi:hypothetical protein